MEHLVQTHRLSVEDAHFHSVVHVVRYRLHPEFVDALNLYELDQPALEFLYDISADPFHLYQSDHAPLFLVCVTKQSGIHNLTQFVFEFIPFELDGLKQLELLGVLDVELVVDYFLRFLNRGG